MEPVAVIAAVLQAGVALALIFFVPGLALGPIIAPGASTPLGRIGRAVGASLLTTSIGCTVLAWLGILAPGTTIAFLVAITGLALVARRRSLRPWRPPSRRAIRWWLGAGAATVLAAGLAIIPSRLAVGDSLLPFTSTVWYYANLARVVATAGGFPAVLPEWGTERPFQTDYLPVTAHTAASLQLLPGDLLVQLELYRMALLIVGLVLAALLFRRWVSSWLALLGAILLVTTVRLEFKYLAYKPETFALDLALFGLWLADRAIVERSRRLTVTAAVTGGLVYLAHAEVFLVYLAAVAGMVVARSFVVSGGRARLGLGIARGFWRRIGLGLGLVALAIVGGTLANGALTGSFRIVGYVTADRVETDGGSAAAAFDPAEVPPGWVLSGDPTWDFYVAAVAPAAVGQPAPHRFLDPRMLPRSILVVWSGLDARDRAELVVLLAMLAVPIAAWPFLDRRRRWAVVTWTVFGVAIFAGSYALFAISHTYVPQRTGPRRIMPYELFVSVGAGVFLLWGIDRLVGRGWRALLPRRGAMLAAGAALAIVCTAMVSSGPVTALDDPDPGITRVGYEAYRWIDGNLPPDARILTNAYTDGALTALSHRVGIVDGRAVYLENPAFLHESTALALGARVVFGDPTGAGARSFLDRERVDHLLVVGPSGSGNDIGGYLPFATDTVALGASPRYTLVRTFGDGRLSLYRVEPGR
ncbi:MAG: hypothetical protein QOF11_1722 [Chloroflexota bacterium]|nr:hypothetical protein [Chloroflexota bacterium]